MVQCPVTQCRRRLIQLISDFRAALFVEPSQRPPSLCSLPQHVVKFGFVPRVARRLRSVEPFKNRILIDPHLGLVVEEDGVRKHETVSAPGIQVTPDQRLCPGGRYLEFSWQVPCGHAELLQRFRRVRLCACEGLEVLLGKAFNGPLREAAAIHCLFIEGTQRLWNEVELE